MENIILNVQNFLSLLHFVHTYTNFIIEIHIWLYITSFMVSWWSKARKANKNRKVGKCIKSLNLYGHVYIGFFSNRHMLLARGSFTASPSLRCECRRQWHKGAMKWPNLVLYCSR